MADRAPTERQSRILEVIRDFTDEHGYPPSVREIGERVGLSSSSTVQSHLKSLEKRGLIHRDPTKPRALKTGDHLPDRREAVAARHEANRLEASLHEANALDAASLEASVPESAVIPIVGRVAAGAPITASENIDGEFVLPIEFARKPGTFILRVQGDSMIDAAILDGDLIVVTPQPDATNGEIVVAMLEGEATVKRFFREARRVRLQPENRSMDPIFADDVTILGRVDAVVRRL